MQEEPRVMSASGLRNLRQAIARFLTYWKGLGGHLVLKHHCAWHLAARAAEHGDPGATGHTSTNRRTTSWA
eukprot:3964820-Alexandrium_andersonii.AAC.1